MEQSKHFNSNWDDLWSLCINLFPPNKCLCIFITISYYQYFNLVKFTCWKKIIQVAKISQNTRMDEAANAFWVYLVPPLLQQGHPQQGAQHHLQEASEDLQEGDSTTSLGSLCHCSITCTAQKGCLVFMGNLLCSSLCPLPLVLSLGTTQKTLALSSLHSPFRYLYILI